MVQGENNGKNSRITSKDIGALIDSSEVEKIGFCEIYALWEGIRSKDYKESITIATEYENYQGVASFEEFKTPSRLIHINLALKEKEFLLGDAELKIIPYPHSSWIYTGTLYKLKNS